MIDNGTVVAGRYRLVRRIGGGGMGVVWEATDAEERDRAVALKHIRLDEPDPRERDRLAEALRREWRLAVAASDHPGVVDMLALVEHDGQPWLVMELLAGRDLRAIVRDEGNLPVRRAARLGVEMAEALAHLHRTGLVHGDVAPGNIMISDDDHAVLTDFGISRPLQATTVSTILRPRGVPAFVPPEVVDGRLPAESADVFGLGAVLLYAVTGRGPWGDGDERTVFGRAVVGTPVVRARGRLGRVLGLMMRRRPRDRPPLPACRSALAGVADGRRPGLSWPLFGHRRLAVVVTAGVVVAALAAGSAVWSIARDADRTRAHLAALATDVDAQRSLDTCGLLGPDDLRRFGVASLVPDYGNFDRCDVFLDHDGRSIQVTAYAAVSDPADPPTIPLRTVGDLQVAAKPPEPLQCGRQVTLPGGTDVFLTASVDAGTEPALCPVVDAATDSTVAALADGGYPTRSQSASRSALAAVDACGLVPRTELPGTPGWIARPGFGRWSCRWEAAGRPAVDLRFDRDVRGPAALGAHQEAVGGRPAVTAATDSGGCEISLQQRRYQRPDGTPGYEVVIVEAEDPTTPDPCESARRIGTAAASRLPPPS